MGRGGRRVLGRAGAAAQLSATVLSCLGCMPGSLDEVSGEGRGGARGVDGGSEGRGAGWCSADAGLRGGLAAAWSSDWGC